MEKITQTEALRFLGMCQNSFKGIANRLGIKGETSGRCTLYIKEDIEKLNTMLANRVPFLIAKLEELTGRKVELK